jgi:hypothetical protein
MAKSVIEEEIYFNNKKIFKDDIEHPYDCVCYDGYAICRAVQCEDNENVPPILKLNYPLRKEIMKSNAKCNSILAYRGLYDLSKKNITYGDIMVLYGVIEKPKTKPITMYGRKWIPAKKIYDVGKWDWFFVLEVPDGYIHINDELRKMLLIKKDGTEYETDI